jgi:hypothetical protein
MSRWSAGLSVAPLLLLLLPAAARAAPPLERFSPVVVHDSEEQAPLTSVQAFAGRVPGVRPGPARPRIYARRVGPWLQYWMLFPADLQTRGPLRTGRHEGDWESIALRLRRGRPVRAVYSQHGTAERCGMRAVRRAGERPVAFLANGSHAAYFVPGVRDRTWPEPNDEADGEGLRVRPRITRIGDEAPPWMRYPGRWGATRAGWVPGETDSPRGPAFQPGWSDPAAWAAAAHPCTRRECDERGECDGRETATAAVLAVLGVLVAFGMAGRRLRRLPV